MHRNGETQSPSRQGRTLFGCLVSVALLLPAPALAGAVVKLQTRDLSRGAVRRQEVTAHIEGRRLRFESSRASRSQSASTVIFDGHRGVLYTLDPEAKTYVEVDPAAIARATEEIRDELEAAQQMAEELLRQLPEDEDGGRGDLLKERMARAVARYSGDELPRPVVRKTEISRTVGGYPCSRRDVFLEGIKVREIWVTEWSRVGLEGTPFAVFLELEEFYTELARSVGQNDPLIHENPFWAFGHLDGFPVLVERFEDNELQEEVHLVSVEAKALDAAAFSVPEGFTRQEVALRRRR